MPADESADPSVNRTSDFRSRYANSTYFDTTVYDLKINFGELDKDADGTVVSRFHSAISMSWLEAKIAAIFLLVNIYGHERERGPIRIPPGVRPRFVSQAEAEQSLSQIVGSLDSNFKAFVESLIGEEKQEE
jgi:hypothetical protein